MGKIVYYENMLPWKKSKYRKLQKRWAQKHAQIQKEFFDKNSELIQRTSIGTKHIALGSLSGMLVLSTPYVAATPTIELVKEQDMLFDDIDQSMYMLADLSGFLPRTVQPLISGQEKEITKILSRSFEIDVRAELEGIRLERNYGYLGAEQHLMRYPGDTMATHFSSSEDSQKYHSSGMAPGRGAWGYFAPSQSALTERDIERERYYIAIQTFIAPGYNGDVSRYRDFFKYRKMILVNPKNGKAVVTVVGDAGPAVWTGKHLGGSPEVMKHLEMVDGKQRGGVLFFFVNDPNDTVPLGPIEPKEYE